MRRVQKQKIGARIRRILYRGAFVVMAGVFIGAVFFVVQNYQCFFYEVKKSLAPQSVSISLSNMYSPVVREAVTVFINDQTTSENLVDFRPQIFSKNLKKKFPFIKQVLVTRPTPEQLSIEVMGVKPCLRFSDRRVLAGKPMLFTQELFEEYGLEKIPQVEFSSTFTAQVISKDLYRFFASIPRSHWKKYALRYDSFEKMYLKPYAPALKFSCIVDAVSLFDTKKLMQAERLYTQLIATTKLSKKRESMLIFDLRFADQIVISQQTGGGGNEYHHAV